MWLSHPVVPRCGTAGAALLRAVSPRAAAGAEAAPPVAVGARRRRGPAAGGGVGWGGEDRYRDVSSLVGGRVRQGNEIK